MLIGKPQSKEKVGNRLRLTRMALQLSQAEICRSTGMNPQSWNHAETGDNRLSLNDAIKLYEIFEIDLNWTYLGRLAFLPRDLVIKVEKLLAEKARDTQAQLDAKPAAKDDADAYWWQTHSDEDLRGLKDHLLLQGSRQTKR